MSEPPFKSDRYDRLNWSRGWRLFLTSALARCFDTDGQLVWEQDFRAAERPLHHCHCCLQGPVFMSLHEKNGDAVDILLKDGIVFGEGFAYDFPLELGVAWLDYRHCLYAGFGGEWKNRLGPPLLWWLPDFGWFDAIRDKSYSHIIVSERIAP